ncbi:MAG TPA: alpha-galactosidase, partial [Magnetospirillaceae bacterium]|nr:alpha-galactosidase [Magnetospirillaceae bacterium]
MIPSRFDRTVSSPAHPADPRIPFRSAILEYRARSDSPGPEPRMTVLDELPVSELFRIAGGTEPEPFADLRSAFLLSNGWQSWSPGWELAPDERMERARVVRRLNIMTDHPGLIPRRDEVLASFLGYARVGEDYLALASIPDRTAPVSFLFRRNYGTVTILAYAEGGRYAAEDLAARVKVIHARGYFALKDALRDSYAPSGRFSRLAFLARPGEPLVPGGYESWYNRYADIDERSILDDLRGLAGNGNLIDRLYIRQGRPTVFQVDDGWERSVGDWRADGNKFPGGMSEIARRIEGAGLIPGIWLAPLLLTRGAPLLREKPGWLLRDDRGRAAAAGWNPAWGGTFYCLDLSIPEVLDYLASIRDRVVHEWGYR